MATPTARGLAGRGRAVQTGVLCAAVAEGAGTRLCIAPLEGRSGNFSGIPDARPLRAVSGEAELPAPAAPSPRPEDDALIIFTSGSTGEPKGVVHTHASLQGRFEAIRRCIGTADFARTLCIMPTHAITLVTNCLYPWLSGNELFITPPYDAMVLMKLGSLVDAHDVTFFVFADERLALIQKHHYPPGLWRPPGGGLKPGEPFVAGVEREALEELGVRISLARYLVASSATFRHGSTAIPWATHVFAATTEDVDLAPLDTHEISAARWGTLGELQGPLRERLLATGTAFWRYRVALHDAAAAALRPCSP